MILAAAFLFSAQGAAMAQEETPHHDFIFHVNVDLSNVPQDTHYQVTCWALLPPSADPLEGEIATGSSGPLQDVNSTLDIGVDANPGKNPADATRYYCALNLMQPQTSQDDVLANNMLMTWDSCMARGLFPPSYPEICAARGEAVSIEAEGPIPGHEREE